AHRLFSAAGSKGRVRARPADDRVGGARGRVYAELDQLAGVTHGVEVGTDVVREKNLGALEAGLSVVLSDRRCERWGPSRRPGAESHRKRGRERESVAV